MIDLRIPTRELNCKSGSDGYFSCEFWDTEGIQRNIEDVTFLNLDLVSARHESFKNGQTHEFSVNTSFSHDAQCEVMGTTSPRIITVNCRRFNE